MYLPWMFLANV